MVAALCGNVTRSAQEIIMFVVPYVRPVHRLAAPQISRYFDRLFDDAFERVDSRTPALDVSETDTTYTVTFEVPGVARDQLKVTAQGRRVTIETVAQANTAPAADQAKTDAPRVLYRERNAVRYARTVSLPTEVDQASSSAKFENGVLTLTLAKKVPAGAQQIAIG